MAEAPPDRILIRDLRIPCIIGTLPEERRTKRDVVVNITLYADLGPAGASDSVDDTVDYSDLCSQVTRLVEASSCLLLERLAERIGEIGGAIDVLNRQIQEVLKPKPRGEMGEVELEDETEIEDAAEEEQEEQEAAEEATADEPQAEDTAGDEAPEDEE